MQVHGVAQGGVGTTTIPRSGGRLVVALAIAAILVIVAVTALLVWAGPLTMIGAEAANPSAGSAVVHDDAGNMPLTGAGAAVVHDDAGDIR